MTPMRYGMSLRSFAEITLRFPTFLRNLLVQLGVQPTEQILRQCCDYYRALTLEDCYHVGRTGSLTVERLNALASVSGLEVALSHLPIDIYHLHRKNIERQYQTAGHYHLTDEEVEVNLVFEFTSQDYWFLFDDGEEYPAIGYWNLLEQRMRSDPFIHDVEDVPLSIISYLRARGRIFKTREEILLYGVRHNWPGAEAQARETGLIP